MDNSTDKYIINAFSELDETVLFNIEKPVMKRVGLNVDHSIEIAKIKKRIKSGITLSIGLLIIFTIYTFSMAFKDSTTMENVTDTYFIISAAYSFVGLLLLFVLLEFRKKVLLISAL